MKKVVFLVITGVATSLSVIAQTQMAVTDSADRSGIQLKEAVVSIQKRNQSSLEVPAAINALSGTDLIKLDVRQFDELSEYIPGMQMQLQSPNNPGYVIRGVTSDDGFINTPIVKDRLLNRFAFTYEDRDGFIKNLSGGDLNGKNTFALRNSTRLFAGENTLVDLVLDYQRDDYPGTSFKNGQYAPAGGDVSPNTMADLEQGKNLYINMISGLCGKSPATRGTYLLRRGTFPATCGTFHATRGTCSPLRGEVTDVRTTLPEALKNPIEYQGNAPALCGTFPASCGTFPAARGTYPLRRGTFPATCGTFPARRGEWPQALQIAAILIIIIYLLTF
jgi:outer membrane receptor protein involved in Fe transport